MAGEGRLTNWLRGCHGAFFVLYATVAAFGTYSCMYAFRKPFAAAAFDDGVGIGAIKLKTLLIVSQVVGYCIAKFWGIKVVSEIRRERRAAMLLALIVGAEAALLLFAILPDPWSMAGLFLNGLSLGMIWGLVIGFIEGRKTSDLLGAGLCASFIVASGFVKTVGRWVMAQGISDAWMPATTGAIFFLPLVGFVWMLAQLPPPSAADEAQRLRRQPMDGVARRKLLWSIAPGMLALTAAYVVLTAFRDFRDNFAAELWTALGYGKMPTVLTTAEVPVAVVALLAVAACMVVKDSRKALLVIHAMIAFGGVLVGVATLAFSSGVIGPATWMIAVGMGLYIGYVPYNCVLFDRLLPAIGAVGTAGFLIYVADAFGYLGSVLLLLYRDFGRPDLSWLAFFKGFSYVTAATVMVLLAMSFGYFARRPATTP